MHLNLFRYLIPVVMGSFFFLDPDALKSRPFEPATDPELKEAYESASNLQKIFRAIYKYSRPGIVQVYTESADQEKQEMPPYGSPSLGSGFVIDSNGVIATNRHVVGNNEFAQVKLFDGRTFKGKVIGADPLTDIALIQLEGAGKLQALEFGDSSKMRVGDWAIAVGSPFGLDGTFTTGVISAVSRPGLDQSGLTFLQTDASINQGNSGGPLLNLDGQVVGINKMIFSPSGGSIGLGFAIPINDIDYVLKALLKDGTVKRGFLGTRVIELPPRFQELMKGRGVFVATVQENTPASRAGLKSGDIILRINNETVASTSELIGKIMRLTPGSTVKLDIVRGTRALKLKAVLSQRPEARMD